MFNLFSSTNFSLGVLQRILFLTITFLLSRYSFPGIWHSPNGNWLFPISIIISVFSLSFVLEDMLIKLKIVSQLEYQYQDWNNYTSKFIQSFVLDLGSHLNLPEFSLFVLKFNSLPFQGFSIHHSVDYLTLCQLLGVDIVQLSLHLQLDLQSLSLQPLLMGQSFSQVMPFEFRQVLQVPQIFKVKITFLGDHLLPIESQSSQFSHSFILKLDPSLPKADFLISSSSYPVLSGPLIFSQQVNSFYFVALKQSFYIVRFHVRRYSGEVANPSITLLLFELLRPQIQLFIIVNGRFFLTDAILPDLFFFHPNHLAIILLLLDRPLLGINLFLL